MTRNVTCPLPYLYNSRKRLDPRDRTSEDQRMHIMRTLVRVHRLQILRMAHHLEFAGDAVAAVHVAGDAGDVQGLSLIHI